MPDPRELVATSRAVAAATEETGQAEEEAEVVPSSVVVDLIDGEIAFEEGGHKDEGSNKALPEPQPETRNDIALAGDTFGLIRSRSTPGENVQKEQEKHKED